MTGGRLRTAMAIGVLGPVLAAVPAGSGDTRPAGGSSSRPARPAAETRAVGHLDRDAVERRPLSADGGGSWLSGLGRTLVALLIVVALIFGVRLVLRRLARGGRSRALPGAVEVVAKMSLSARQQLVLVRLGRRLVLVGTGPEGMTTLSEVTDADEVSALLGEAGGAGKGTARGRDEEGKA